MRRIFIDLWSLENPSSLERRVLTISPSSKVTGLDPSSSSLTIRPFARVDFPDPDSPVKKTVKPLWLRGGLERSNSRATALKVNHSGISLPLIK